MSDAAKPQGYSRSQVCVSRGSRSCSGWVRASCCRSRCCPRRESCCGSASPTCWAGSRHPSSGRSSRQRARQATRSSTTLPLLFAVGVAIGFARKADGSTALAAVVGYLVVQAVFKTMSPIVLAGEVDKAGEQAQINYSVFAGIVDRPAHRVAVRPVSHHPTAVLPRILRRQAIRPDRGVAGLPVPRVRDELLLSDLRCRA